MLIFWGAYIRRSLSTEGNLRFKIDWASLVVRREFTVFALFCFVIEGNFSGAYIWRGDLTEGFLRYEFGGAYTWRRLFSEFYGMIDMKDIKLNTKEVLPGGKGGGKLMSHVWILKLFVSVFINACRLLLALPSLSQFGRGRLSLVAISFYALSILFEPCRSSEFTLAGLTKRYESWKSKFIYGKLIFSWRHNLMIWYSKKYIENYPTKFLRSKGNEVKI